MQRFGARIVPKSYQVLSTAPCDGKHTVIIPWYAKSCMVPPAGLEPATSGLRIPFRGRFVLLCPALS